MERIKSCVFSCLSKFWRLLCLIRILKIVILFLASALAALLMSSCGPRVTDTANTPDAEGIIQTAVAQVTQDF